MALAEGFGLITVESTTSLRARRWRGNAGGRLAGSGGGAVTRSGAAGDGRASHRSESCGRAKRQAEAAGRRRVLALCA